MTRMSRWLGPVDARGPSLATFFFPRFFVDFLAQKSWGPESQHHLARTWACSPGVSKVPCKKPISDGPGAVLM